MSQPGTLEAIWIKRVRRGPMDPAERALAVAGRGLDGNANQGGKRQVTLIEAERWEDACRELGADADPSARRANLLVRGLELAGNRDRVLAIGPCRLRVVSETRPCRLMDEIHPGLQGALEADGRGGVYGEVIEGGEITLGDPVAWVDEAEGDGVRSREDRPG